MILPFTQRNGTCLLVACLEKCPVSGAFTFNCQRERNEMILILKACLQATQLEHYAAATAVIAEPKVEEAHQDLQKPEVGIVVLKKPLVSCTAINLVIAHTENLISSDKWTLSSGYSRSLMSYESASFLVRMTAQCTFKVAVIFLFRMQRPRKRSKTRIFSWREGNNKSKVKNEPLDF